MTGIVLDGLQEPQLIGRGVPPVKSHEALEHGYQHLCTRLDTDVDFSNAKLLAEGLEQSLKESRRLRSLGDHLLVLGMGGSALGARALLHALSEEPSVSIVDNVDPRTVSRVLKSLDPVQTTVLVISKSGHTLETLALWHIVWPWLHKHLGPQAKARVCFITDPHKGYLRSTAQRLGIRCIDFPEQVGGRFSVFTPVGLLPAAFADIDVRALISGATQATEVFRTDALRSTAAHFAKGVFHSLQSLNARQLVLFAYDDRLQSLGAWFQQLWNESLGKFDAEGKRVGQTAFCARGTSDQHSLLQLLIQGPLDKLIVMLRDEERMDTLHIPAQEIPEEMSDNVGHLLERPLSDVFSAMQQATHRALLAAGVPVLEWRYRAGSAEGVGALMMNALLACGVLGYAIDIDPFGQPGVESGKKLARDLLMLPAEDLSADSVEDESQEEYHE